MGADCGLERHERRRRVVAVLRPNLLERQLCHLCLLHNRTQGSSSAQQRSRTTFAEAMLRGTAYNKQETFEVLHGDGREYRQCGVEVDRPSVACCTSDKSSTCCTQVSRLMAAVQVRQLVDKPSGSCGLGSKCAPAARSM